MPAAATASSTLRTGLDPVVSMSASPRSIRNGRRNRTSPRRFRGLRALVRDIGGRSAPCAELKVKHAEADGVFQECYGSVAWPPDRANGRGIPPTGTFAAVGGLPATANGLGLPERGR